MTSSAPILCLAAWHLGYGHATRMLAVLHTLGFLGGAHIVAGRQCAPMAAYAASLGVTLHPGMSPSAVRQLAESRPWSRILIDHHASGGPLRLGPWLGHIAECWLITRPLAQPPHNPEDLTLPRIARVVPAHTLPGYGDPPAGDVPFPLAPDTTLVVHSGPRDECAFLLRIALAGPARDLVGPVVLCSPHRWPHLPSRVRQVDHYPARAWWQPTPDPNLRHLVTAAGANSLRQSPGLFAMLIRHFVHL